MDATCGTQYREDLSLYWDRTDVTTHYNLTAIDLSPIIRTWISAWSKVEKGRDVLHWRIGTEQETNIQAGKGLNPRSSERLFESKAIHDITVVNHSVQLDV